MNYTPIPENDIPSESIIEPAKSIDDAVDANISFPNLQPYQTGSTAAYKHVTYKSPIQPAQTYGGFYPRSDLWNFIFDWHANPQPFGESGFYGVTTGDKSFRSRNSSTTRGDRTLELVTDFHELVFHVTNKWTDNDAMGFYHTRRMEKAMLVTMDDLLKDPYFKPGIYRN